KTRKPPTYHVFDVFAHIVESQAALKDKKDIQETIRRICALITHGEHFSWFFSYRYRYYLQLLQFFKLVSWQFAVDKDGLLEKEPFKELIENLEKKIEEDDISVYEKK